METVYENLNKNLYRLQNTNIQQYKHANIKHHTKFYPQTVNLDQVNFTKDEIKILELGPNYALQKPVKHYTKELVIDTNNAISNLDNKVTQHLQIFGI
jgi:hypothetical protein